MAPTTAEERIREIQKKTGSTRKEAIRKLKASQKGARKAKASKEDRSVDAKSNDKPESPVPAKRDAAKKGKTAGQAVVAAVNKLDNPVAAAAPIAAPPSPVTPVPTPTPAPAVGAAPGPAAAPVKPTRGEAIREGHRQHAIAGRPSREELNAVYGVRADGIWPAIGSWQERAKKGIPAEKFQQALAIKKANPLLDFAQLAALIAQSGEVV